MLCAGPRVGPALEVPVRLLRPLGSSSSPSPPAPLLPPVPGNWRSQSCGWVEKHSAPPGGDCARPVCTPKHCQVLSPASTGSGRLELEDVCVYLRGSGGPFSSSGRGARRSWVGRRPACVPLAGCGGGRKELGMTAGGEFRVAVLRLRRRRPLRCRRLWAVWTGSLPPGGLALKEGASSRSRRRAWTPAGWMGQSHTSIACFFCPPLWDRARLRGL